MAKTKKTSKTPVAHMFLHDGKAVMRGKLEDGSYRTCARALLKPESVYSRVLKVIYNMGGMRSTKEITRLYCQKYAVNTTFNQIGARLSELFTLGLVQRMQSEHDKRVALYSIVPGIDVANSQELYKLAIARLSLIRDYTKMNHCVLPASPASLIFEA